MTLETRTERDMDTNGAPRNGRGARRRFLRRLGWLPVAGLLTVAATVPLPSAAHAGPVSENGIAPVCKNIGGHTGDAHITLTAKDGYIITPDLDSIYMWSYSAGNDAFQYPGPIICVHEGDTVTITLQNQLKVPTSLNVLGVTGETFSGVDAADGKAFAGPATPNADDLAAGDLIPSVASGGAGTYSFVASHAGTYLYESGTSPQLQDQMGLVGALIVRPCEDLTTLDPATHRPTACTPSTTTANRTQYDDYVYDPSETNWTPGQGAPSTVNGLASSVSTQFEPDREFLHLLSEVDPDIHLCFEEAVRGESVSTADPGFASRCDPQKKPYTYAMADYKARYFFINGRAFPDTVDANDAEHLPSQPYSALVHVVPRTASDLAPAVIRYLNASPVADPFHPHAQHEVVVGMDGQPRISKNADGTVSDLTDDHFGITVAPSQTLETFFSWVDAVGWDPATRPISFGGKAQNFQGGVGGAGTNQDFSGVYDTAPGVIVPQEADKINGEFWSGTPYLGYQHRGKPGELQFNECGEYYDVAHSHALFQVTNYGGGVGGMLTMIRIDPIGGCKDS
jgi:FtsP/CotA-like multicopper oxidase with cupredoxin domain